MSGQSYRQIQAEHLAGLAFSNATHPTETVTRRFRGERWTEPRLLTARERGYASDNAGRCHAALMGVIESKGLGVFDMSSADMVAAATPAVLSFVLLKGFAGWLFNAAIKAGVQVALTMLVTRVRDWLAAKVEAWVNRDKLSTGYRCSAAVAYVSGLQDELRPVFAGAREFLEAGV